MPTGSENNQLVDEEENYSDTERLPHQKKNYLQQLQTDKVITYYVKNPNHTEKIKKYITKLNAVDYFLNNSKGPAREQEKQMICYIKISTSSKRLNQGKKMLLCNG